MGGFFVLAVIREFAPIFCAIIVAGVAGTAITADLGARKIREELDALQVLGVDPVKNLVVPRFLALMLVTGLFDVFAIVAGVAGGLLANASTAARIGPFFATFLPNANTTDLWGSRAQVHALRRDHRDRLLLQGHDGLGGAEGVGPRRQRGGRDDVPEHRRAQLRLHADAARDAPGDQHHPLTRNIRSSS